MEENQILSEEQYQELEGKVEEKWLELVANERPITDKDLVDAKSFALCIIFDTNSFKEFAISMMDYLGLSICPYCKELYKDLYQVAFIQNHNMLSPEIVDNFSEGDMRHWFHQFIRDEIFLQHEKAKFFKENIDELQFLVKRQRESGEFKKMLDFVGRSRHIAPYNAMLVEMQKPGATFVFSGKKWQEYGRMIKPNAQQLITLMNFGPVQCLFDFSDTEPIPGVKAKEETELMEMWDNGLKNPEGNIDPETLKTLIDNLQSYGVFLDESFLAANTYGGYIMPYRHEIKVPIAKNETVSVQSRFLISVNRQRTNVEKFHTICHELGHLFCNHQSYDPSKQRRPSHKEREFEAETVAWLVCKRCGVMNPSEEYLATYAPSGEIPICSSELIMKAVNEIEKMLKGPVMASKSLWYKEDDIFKRYINDTIKRRKEAKKKAQKVVRF